jgi:MFS family permease
MGVPIGVILSSLTFSVVRMLFPTSDQFLSIGWRIPFWISVILVVVGLFVRLSITETPAFERVKEERQIVATPILEVLRNHWKTVLLAGGAFFLTNGSFYIFITFVITYGKVALKMANADLVFLNAIIAGAIVSFFVLPLAGYISDKTGRLPIYLAGAALLGLLAFPMFWLIDTKDPWLIMLALCLGQFGLSMMYGPQAAFFSELFGANVRYSGASLGYQFASIFAGGLAPTVATLLLAWSGNMGWPIALYLVGMAIITLVCTYFAGETRPRIVRDAVPAAGTIEGAAGS